MSKETNMSREKDFSGKVVLITGGGTGMGAATAELLAERGARVAIVGRRDQPLRDVASRITAAGGEVLVIPTDVGDPAAMHAAVEKTVARFGALHYAVNNAGTASEHFDVPELPIEVWDDTVRVNLSALFYALRAELPDRRQLFLPLVLPHVRMLPHVLIKSSLS